MKSLPNIIQFAIRFLLLYLVISLLHAVPLVKQINIGVYTTLQQAVFNTFHPTVRTDFDLYKPVQGQNFDFDFSVKIYDKASWSNRLNGAKGKATVNQNARLLSIVPFSFLLALIFASPSTWKRKLIGLVVSGLFLLTYLALKYTNLINTNAEALSPDNWSIWMSLSKLLEPCYRTHEAMFILIVPIWLMSTLTIKDLKWFTE